MQGQVGLREAPKVPALCCSWSGDHWTERPAGAEGAWAQSSPHGGYDCVHCAEEDGRPRRVPAPQAPAPRRGVRGVRAQGWGGTGCGRVPGHLPCLFMVVPGVRRWWKWRVTAPGGGDMGLGD